MRSRPSGATATVGTTRVPKRRWADGPNGAYLIRPQRQHRPGDASEIDGSFSWAWSAWRDDSLGRRCRWDEDATDRVKTEFLSPDSFIKPYDFRRELSEG